MMLWPVAGYLEMKKYANRANMQVQKMKQPPLELEVHLTYPYTYPPNGLAAITEILTFSNTKICK